MCYSGYADGEMIHTMFQELSQAFFEFMFIFIPVYKWLFRLHAIRVCVCVCAIESIRFEYISIRYFYIVLW